MSSARQFAILQIFFLLGVVLASTCNVPLWMVISSISVCCVAATTPCRFRILALLLPVAFAAGILRMQHARSVQLHDPLVQRAGTTLTLVGTVSDEVDRRLDGQKLALRVSAIKNTQGEMSLDGTILATVGLYPEYQYKDRITIRCRIEKPGMVEGFRYDDYLALSGIFTVCRSPAILVTERWHGFDVLGMIFAGKQLFLDRVNALLPEPHSSLLAAMLIGARRGLPNDLLTAFQRAGITHIIALSGFNITILATAVFSVALAVGLSRRAAFWVILGMLVLFVLGTGAPSSVVRAAVMGFLVLLARRLGRQSSILYALLFAGTVMVIVQPRVLLHNVGFQLSFLATFGLVTLSERIGKYLRRIPTLFGIREILTATLAATAGTIPIMVTAFGRFSVVSPLVNILVLPLVPIIMLFGFLAVLLPVVGVAFASAAWILCTWMMAVATAIGSLPFASVPFTVARSVPILLPVVVIGVVMIARRTVLRMQQFLVLCE